MTTTTQRITEVRKLQELMRLLVIQGWSFHRWGNVSPQRDATGLSYAVSEDEVRARGPSYTLSSLLASHCRGAPELRLDHLSSPLSSPAGNFHKSKAQGALCSRGHAQSRPQFPCLSVLGALPEFLTGTNASDLHGDLSEADPIIYLFLRGKLRLRGVSGCQRSHSSA